MIHNKPFRSCLNSLLNVSAWQDLAIFWQRRIFGIFLLFPSFLKPLWVGVKQKLRTEGRCWDPKAWSQYACHLTPNDPWPGNVHSRTTTTTELLTINYTSCHLLNTYCGLGPILSTLHVWTHSILTAALWEDRHHHYPRFAWGNWGIGKVE